MKQIKYTDNSRREFIKKCGKIAVTAPAATVILSAAVTPKNAKAAYAPSDNTNVVIDPTKNDPTYCSKSENYGSIWCKVKQICGFGERRITNPDGTTSCIRG